MDNMDDDLKEGLKKSMSEPAKGRDPNDAKETQIDGIIIRARALTPEQLAERKRQKALEDHRG